MKILCTVVLALLSFGSFAQVSFWTEDFGSGCNSGQLATAYASPNGTWTVSNTGTNTASANVWYVSAKENGNAAGQCGSGCGADRTLHLGNVQVPLVQADQGAAYYEGLAGFCGFFPCASTSRRVESPSINCSAYTSPSVSFVYLEGGNAIDNATMWYYDGAVWSLLVDLPKTGLDCSPQGIWTTYSIALPPSASNNPGVKIGFQWVNNDDGDATDPSVAIDDITVSGIQAGGDTTPPVVTCPQNQTVALGPACSAVVPNFIPLATVTDNLDTTPTVTQSPAAGTPLSGSQTITLTATDDAGNSANCSFTATALDQSPPVVNCLSSSITVALDANCSATIPSYTTNVSLTDNCTLQGALSVTQTPAAGSALSSPVLVTVTATDAAGNSSSCSYSVSPADQTPPVVSCNSANVTAPLLGNCLATVPSYVSNVTLSDNCTSAGDLIIGQSPPEGSVISGPTSVTVLVTDEAGNSSFCTYTVQPVDQIEPTVTCLVQEVVVPTGLNCSAAIPDYAPYVSLTDNCTQSAALIVVQSPPAGTSFSSPVPVTVTATDESGNSASCSFTAAPEDDSPPSVVCNSSVVEVPLDGNCLASIPAYAPHVTLSDNCTLTGALTVAQTPDAGTIISSPTDVTVTATDESGNSASCTYQVEPVDLTPLAIQCPSDINETIALGQTTADLIIPNPPVTDNCSGVISVTNSINGTSSASGIYPTGITPLTFTAVNEFGESASCTIQVEVTALACCPPDLNCDGYIGVADLLIFNANFGCLTGCPGDLNGDNIVSVADLLIFTAAFGLFCP